LDSLMIAIPFTRAEITALPFTLEEKNCRG